MKPKAEKPSKKEQAKESKSEKPSEELGDDQLEQVSGGSKGWDVKSNTKA